jgi:hypothetical protein
MNQKATANSFDARTTTEVNNNCFFKFHQSDLGYLSSHGNIPASAYHPVTSNCVQRNLRHVT